VLVTTLTKRMAEDLTEYYAELGVRVRYLHADVDTLDRIEILRDLRRGEFDVLVGINLLREGLDLPEVSLVAILDADKEGFLRAERSLIQTCGRAARNVRGRVIMYADRVTASMKVAIDETERRRTLQAAFNKKHKITPKTVERAIHDIRGGGVEQADYHDLPEVARAAEPLPSYGDAGLLPKAEEIPKLVANLKKQMHAAAEDMEFERAATIRDRIKSLEALELRLR
jgi:excinuclease ABC subunit B